MFTLKHTHLKLGLPLVGLVLYMLFAYTLKRTSYTTLIVIYSLLFYIFYKVMQSENYQSIDLTYLAFIFRSLFILAIPNLSQDFYRFIWDGRMILEGLNPYLYTVESFISKGNLPVNQAQELYDGMGKLNAGHFSNYPPVNQFCFFLASLFGSTSILTSVIGMRLLIIAADFGTLYFGKKLLEAYQLPSKNIFWYILNPFIIIELTGNLHFEGVMIFFLIWSLYLLHKNKWIYTAVILALSISVKLIPLMFLPLFFQKFVTEKESLIFNFSKLIMFYIIVLGSIIVLFLPFYNGNLVNNYFETVSLWFQNFEFNASLYYIARSIGYMFRGYNEIAIIGKLMSVAVIVFVLYRSFMKDNKTLPKLITNMLLVLAFYYFTATTVHPWYIAMLLILSVFTKYKFPLAWSFVIVLSYLGYLGINKAEKSENLYIIALEYSIVYGVFIWDILKRYQNKKHLIYET